MADNSFRQYRGRDDVDPRRGGSDPLAELARLIGQADPYADHAGRQDYQDSNAAHSGPDARSSGLDWTAGEGYADEHPGADQHHGPPPFPPAAEPAYPPQERGYEDEARGDGRYFPTSPPPFTGFGGEADYHDAQDQRAGQSSRPLPVFAPNSSSDGYAFHDAGHESDGYGPDASYDQPSPRRRGGLIVVMAVLGLIVVGTAGAFAYRAVFGGYAMLGLPPIIKASNGPNKIMPSYGEAKPDNPAQTTVANAASTENLVPRDEQPLNMDAPKVGSRVVSTIPIVSPQSPAASSGAVAPAAVPAPPVAAPQAPVTSPPPPTLASAAQPPPTVASAPPPAAAAPAGVTPEPKKVRTVTIRADQSASPDAQATAAPASAPAAPLVKAASRPAPAASKPSAPAAPQNAPMSIVPGSEGEAVVSPPPPAPSRTRSATPPLAVASAEPAAAVAPAAPSGGGYAVQVTSQHSEADAQASFRELRAKYPGLLKGEPIIRRADLGAKGVYYRALVGPFASMEEAAGMCSSLKAAGGNCIVQRN